MHDVKGKKKIIKKTIARLWAQLLGPVYSKSSVLQSILVHPLSCCSLQTLDALCPPQECTWT